MTKGARSLAPGDQQGVYHGYPPGTAASSSALVSAAGEYWVGTGGGVQIDKGGRAWCWLRSPPASVSCTWLSHGLGSWLCMSAGMGMLSRLAGGSLVHPPPLSRRRRLVALTGLSGETGQTLGT